MPRLKGLKRKNARRVGGINQSQILGYRVFSSVRGGGGGDGARETTVEDTEKPEGEGRKSLNVREKNL